MLMHLEVSKIFGIIKDLNEHWDCDDYIVPVGKNAHWNLAHSNDFFLLSGNIRNIFDQL